MASRVRSERRRAWYARCVAVLCLAFSPPAFAASQPPDQGWHRVASGDTHCVDTLHEPDAVWIRMRGRVAAPIDATCRVLANVSAYDDWLPGLAESQVVDTPSGTSLIYGRIDAPWPMRDRDYLSQQRWRRLEDGLELETRATREPSLASALDLPTDTVRLRRMLTLWSLRPDGPDTLIEYVVREPGARNWIQDLLVRRSASITPTLLSNLQDAARTAPDGEDELGDVCAELLR